MSNLPSVTVNTLNTHSGASKEIERLALFVGVGKNNHRLTAVSAQSDLTKLFGANSDLKKQLEAAKQNAGEGWFAYVYEMNEQGYDFVSAVKKANKQISVEYVVNTYTTGVEKNSLNQLQGLYSSLLAEYGRRVFFIQAVRGIAQNETWEAYLNELKALTSDVAADHVMVVPELFGNDTGALAGRLANRAVTIADTPARVKTGALVGLASITPPLDTEQTPLDLAHLNTLAGYRFSSVMWHPDYDGLYWADGKTLDVEGGDYQVIENVRVVDKVARRIRLKAIAKLGDRSFNSTQASIEMHKNYFAEVMRKMAISTLIGTQSFPGECFPPSDDSVVITWKDKNTVNIYIKVRPVDCPKEITVGIFLDLTTLGDSDE